MHLKDKTGTTAKSPETKHSEVPAPLISDPQRQACDSLSGYIYQIWVSVHAWLELGDEEVLYLEGAEDIDRVYGNGVETIQVKNLEANLTLRSKSVIQAISNYWDLRQMNPNRHIKFRFLTTAVAGTERGFPFGKEEKGLDLWQSAHRAEEPARILIDFLKGIESLPSSLREYLDKSDIKTIQEELIRPMYWQLGSGDIEYVKDAVKQKLVLLGDKFEILPEQSKKAAPFLLKTVLETACSKKQRRLLDRGKLLELFEETTTQRIPRDELKFLRQLQEQIVPTFAVVSDLTPPIHLYPMSRIQRAIPDLEHFLVPRESLVTDCARNLEKSGVMILTGLVGMGKTTLAKLIARQRKNWVWVNLSGVQTEVVIYVLQSIGKLLDGDRCITDVLIDDIDMSPNACRQYEETLGGLMITLQSRNGRVILTSQREPSQRLQRALSLRPESIIKVPSLSEAEISSLLTTSGFAGNQTECNQHAKIIFFQTSGHPQLVQATIRYLSTKGWPHAHLDDLLTTPKEIAQEKRQMRQLLIDGLSNAQKTLVYRLSAIGMFRRDHAAEIGAKAAVSIPGDVFESLVGPWIEQISNGYFRVSPLIGYAANEALGLEEIRTVHKDIAESLLACGNLSVYEAIAIFTHAFVGKHRHILLIAVTGIMTAAEDIRKVLLNELSWFLAFDPKPGQLLFEDPHVNFALRLLQFRIAIAVDPAKAEPIAERWNQELVNCIPQELYLYERFLYVLNLLLFFQAPIRPKRLIACFVEMEELLRALPELRKRMAALKLPPSVDSPRSDISDPAKLFFVFAVNRCTDAIFLKELINEIVQVPADLRSRMLSIFSDSISNATMLIDRVWLSESKKNNPNWESCLTIFRNVAEKSRKWGISNLAYAVTRGTAIILDEYLRESEKAIAVIDAVENELGLSHVTQDERATILYNNKDYHRALEIWQEMLRRIGNLPIEYDITIWTCRKAAISAAMTDDWSLAAQLFLQGYDKAKQTNILWATAGLMADAAFAHWKAGQHAQLLTTLQRTLTLLESLPAPETDFISFAMRKNIGFIILWIKNSLAGSQNENYAEPYAGMCSNPEPNARLRELPSTLIEYCWIMLADIEHELSAGQNIYNIVCNRFDTSEYAVAQVLLRVLHIRVSIAQAQYEDIPLQAFHCARATTMCRASSDPLIAAKALVYNQNFQLAMTPEEMNFAEHILVTALICAVKHKQSETALTAWRAAVNIKPQLQPLSSFLSSATATMSLPLAEARKQMRNPALGWHVQTLSALRLTTDSDTRPDDIFQAHGFLLRCIQKNVIKKEASSCLADLVTTNWIHQLQFPVLLKSPMFIVPVISKACQSNSRGFKKIAEVLLAASTAISTKVPTGFIHDLEHLRDEG